MWKILYNIHSYPTKFEQLKQCIAARTIGAFSACLQSAGYFWNGKEFSKRQSFLTQKLPSGGPNDRAEAKQMDKIRAHTEKSRWHQILRFNVCYSFLTWRAILRVYIRKRHGGVVKGAAARRCRCLRFNRKRKRRRVRRGETTPTNWTQLRHSVSRAVWLWLMRRSH